MSFNPRCARKIFQRLTHPGSPHFDILSFSRVNV
jgi:hypothetical protein